MRTYRHEQKFVVDENTLQIMKAKLGTLLASDQHQKGDSYRIRSLYFDTYHQKSYRENDAGIEERKKYRIRVYDDPANNIRLEIKHKLKDRNFKETCPLTLDQFHAIVEGSLRFDRSFPKALNMLLLDMRIHLLRPSIIVENERSAYVYEVGNVRITFDRNVSFSFDFDRFLDMSIPKHPLLPPNQHVFEVKFDHVLPEFIAQTIETGDLYRRTFLKFYFSHLKSEGKRLKW